MDDLTVRNCSCCRGRVVRSPATPGRFLSGVRRRVGHKRSFLAVSARYRATGLTDRLKIALRGLGPEDRLLTPQQLGALDHFHTCGLAATVDLAQLPGISADMSVLDVGSGVGGPARFLATTYGCRLTGVDLSEPQYPVSWARTATTSFLLTGQCHARGFHGATELKEQTVRTEPADVSTQPIGRKLATAKVRRRSADNYMPQIKITEPKPARAGNPKSYLFRGNT